MSTPPTGEDPYRPPAPDGSPTAPQPQPAQPPQPAQASWAPPPQQQPSYGPPYGPQQGFGPPSAQQAPWGPPPGWQPGPPPKRPRDRKRTALIAALATVGLLIVAGVALLVYVLSSTILDPAAVEDAVSTQFEERNGVALDLECKHRMIVRPRADYDCEGTTAAGEEVEIEIRITDSTGAYTWAEKD